MFYLLFIFIITLLVVLSYLLPENRKFFQLFLLVLVLSVAGFRENLSGDYSYYVDWYVNKKRDSDFEFGFVWLMNLFRWFNCSYHILFFFFSFCTIILVYLGIKKYTQHSNLAFLFFLLIPALYLNSWSIIRQAFAMAIIFYAFQFLITKKYLIYFVLISVAISIHYTAIFPFLVCLVVYKFADKIKTVHLSVLLFLSLVLSNIHWITFFTLFFESTHYMYYFSENFNPVNGLKIISLNILAVFLLFYNRKIKATYPFQKYFIVLSVFSIIVTNLFATDNQLNRFSHYFTLFEIIVFADIIFLETKTRRIILLMGFYLYGVSLFLYTIKADYNLNEQGTKYIPYNSVFYKFDDAFFMMGTDYLIDPSLAKEVK
jgi:transmembrane protein EpsG